MEITTLKGFSTIASPFHKVQNPDAPRLGFAWFETWNLSFLFAG